MEKVCPRCGGLFSCMNDRILECQCAFVQLDARQRAYLGTHYTDCLCHACLKDIQDYFYAFDVNPRYTPSRTKPDTNLDV